MNQRNTKHTHADELSMDELYDCYETLARIVKRYGKDYLPLFERVHKEIESRKSENRMVDIAHRVAKNNDKSVTHFGTQNGTH